MTIASDAKSAGRTSLLYSSSEGSLLSSTSTSTWLAAAGIWSCNWPRSSVAEAALCRSSVNGTAINTEVRTGWTSWPPPPVGSSQVLVDNTIFRSPSAAPEARVNVIPTDACCEVDQKKLRPGMMSRKLAMTLLGAATAAEPPPPPPHEASASVPSKTQASGRRRHAAIVVMDFMEFPYGWAINNRMSGSTAVAERLGCRCRRQIPAGVGGAARFDPVHYQRISHKDLEPFIWVIPDDRNVERPRRAR